MSALDNVVGGFVYGQLYPAMMGINAAGQSTQEGLMRGADKNLALANGVANGLIEFFTEKMGYDRIMKYIATPTAAKGLAEKIVTAAFSNAGSEFLEEATGNIAQQLADTIIMGDKSNFKALVDSYISEGATPDDAANSALFEMYVKDTLKNGLSGAISGGILAGGRQMADHVRTGRTVLDSNISDAALSAALGTEPYTATNRVARDIVSRMQRGERPSAEDFGNLYSAMKQEGVHIDEKTANSDKVNNVYKKQGGGVAMTTATAKLSNAEYTLLDEFGKATKKHIIVKDFIGNGKGKVDAANGFYDPSDPDTIYISAHSERPLYQIAKHEVVHSFSNTLAGAAYINRVAADFKELNPGAYRKTVEKIKANYENAGFKVPSKKFIKEEIAADASWKMLNRYGEVYQIAKDKPGLAKMIYGAYIDIANKMNGVYKAAPGGIGKLYDTMAADEVNAVIENFHNALGEKAKDIEPSYVGYSIKHTVDNEPVVVITKDILNGVPKEQWGKVAMSELRKFSEGIQVGNDVIKVNRKSGREYANSGYSKFLFRKKPNLYKDKMNASANLDEVLRASGKYASETPNHPRKDSIKRFERGEVLLEIGGNKYKAEVVIGITAQSEKLFYDIVGINGSDFTLKNQSGANGQAENQPPIRSNLTDINNISQDGENVNTFSENNLENPAKNEKSNENINISLENNSENPVRRIIDDTKTPAFKRWFGDWQNDPKHASKVVNEDGTPKVVHHGTSHGGFNFFAIYSGNFGLFGRGAYFTENPQVAEEYTNKGNGNNKQVYDCYLNIRNPMDMDAEADIGAWKKALRDMNNDEIDVDFSNVKTNEDAFRALVDELSYNMYYRDQAYDFVESVFSRLNIDGITHIGGGRRKDSKVRHRVWIAFYPYQIKSVDNIGTYDDWDDNIYYSPKDSDKYERAAREIYEKLKSGEKIDFSDETNSFTADEWQKIGDIVNGYYANENPNATEEQKRDFDGRYSDVYKNSMHKEHWNENTQKEADRRAEEFKYERKSNDKTYNDAAERMRSMGVNEAYSYLLELARSSDKWTADNVMEVWAVASMLQNEGREAEAVTLISAAQKRTTNAAQVVQANAVLDKLSPEGLFAVTVNAANDINEKALEKAIS